MPVHLCMWVVQKRASSTSAKSAAQACAEEGVGRSGEEDNASHENKRIPDLHRGNPTTFVGTRLLTWEPDSEGLPHPPDARLAPWEPDYFRK
jgi:hypothetical protein